MSRALCAWGSGWVGGGLEWQGQRGGRCVVTWGHGGVAGGGVARPWVMALGEVRGAQGTTAAQPGDTPGTRMEIRTWRSAIADLKPTPPGAPSGALGKGTPGWVWRCDAAISRYKEKRAFCALFGVFPRAAKTKKNDVAFSLIPKVFSHFSSKPSYRAPKWALLVRVTQKERLKSPQKSPV